MEMKTEKTILNQHLILRSNSQDLDLCGKGDAERGSKYL